MCVWRVCDLCVWIWGYSLIYIHCLESENPQAFNCPLPPLILASDGWTFESHRLFFLGNLEQEQRESISLWLVTWGTLREFRPGARKPNADFYTGVVDGRNWQKMERILGVPSYGVSSLESCLLSVLQHKPVSLEWVFPLLLDLALQTQGVLILKMCIALTWKVN